MSCPQLSLRVRSDCQTLIYSSVFLTALSHLQKLIRCICVLLWGTSCYSKSYRRNYKFQKSTHLLHAKWPTQIRFLNYKRNSSLSMLTPAGGRLEPRTNVGESPSGTQLPCCVSVHISITSQGSSARNHQLPRRNATKRKDLA